MNANPKRMTQEPTSTPMETAAAGGVWDYVAVWVDRRSATVAYMSKTMDKTKHLVAAGIAFSAWPDSGVTSSREKFHELVIDSIGPVQYILVLGPDEAKLELQKALIAQGREKNVVGMMTTAAKMADSYLIDTSRHYFLEKHYLILFMNQTII